MPGKARKRTGASCMKQIKRHVNLFRTALQIVCFFSHSKEERFMRARKSSFGTIYRIALHLRNMFISRMNYSPSDQARGFGEDENIPDTNEGSKQLSSAEIGNITLGELFPGFTERSKVMHNTLEISSAILDALCVRDED